MTKYFDRFPEVSYNGVPARNILTKIDFTEETKNSQYINFNYTINESFNRPDVISYVYYDSPQYDWMIYISNEVTDPYHEFYQTELQLQSNIKKKYGSVQAAKDKILFYRNNWAPDDGELTVAMYESLDIRFKKYYKPVLNDSLQVLRYVRLKEDWVRSTNAMVSLTLNTVEGISVDDIITQSSSNAEGTVTGIDATTNTVTLQHITGSFMTGAIGSYTASIVTELVRPIPVEESTFWTAVSAYDYEYEANEQRKHLTLIKKEFVPDVERLFIERMS